MEQWFQRLHGLGLLRQKILAKDDSDGVWNPVFGICYAFLRFRSRLVPVASAAVPHSMPGGLPLQHLHGPELGLLVHGL